MCKNSSPKRDKTLFIRRAVKCHSLIALFYAKEKALKPAEKRTHKAERTANTFKTQRRNVMKKEFCSQKPLFMNLQFFAEDGDSQSVDDNAKPGEETTDGVEGNETELPKGKTYEDALAEIAAAQAEVKKAKADRDAALRKAGDVTKQLRAKMTEAEIEAEKAAQEKEEHDAYVKDLESFKRKTEAKERYTSQYATDLTDLKLVAELAEKAAEAETKGDMETLAEVNRQYVTAIRKQDKAQFMGSRGRLNFGDGEDSKMTKEEIFAIKDAKKRQEAIAKNLSLFQKTV